LDHRVQKITSALVERGHLLLDKESGQVSAFVGSEAGFGGGAVLVVCKPEGLIRLLLQRVIEIYPKATLDTIDERGSLKAWPIGNRMSEATLDRLTEGVIMLFLETLGDKLSESLNEQIDESMLLFKRLYISGLAKDMREKPGLEDVESFQFKGLGTMDQVGKSDKTIDGLVTKAARRKLSRLTETLGRFGLHKRINDIPHLLRSHYDAVKPIWEDAQDISAANVNSPWKEFIKIKYPSLCDYDYLIIRLGPSTDIPDAEMERILASDNASHTHSAVSSIALEHAARLCGARKYQYKTAQLFRILGTTTNSTESKTVSKKGRATNRLSRQKASKKG
jgi:hypothetical protein